MTRVTQRLGIENRVFGNHERRIRGLEFRHLLNRWIYVGTVGVDGADAEITDNPYPYAPGDTPGPIPFVAGTNGLGGFAPLRFKISSATLCLEIDGRYTGVSPGDTVFTLPTLFIPDFETPVQGLIADYSGAFAAAVDASGNYIYKGTI